MIPIPSLLLVGSFICLAAAVLLSAREIQVRCLNGRVARAVKGLPSHGGYRSRLLEWLSFLGTRYRRFYAPESLEQLRMTVQNAGFNPHRAMPIIIGAKTLSMLLVPVIAAFLSMGAPFGDRIIVILMAIVLSIMGPRFLLKFISRRCNAAIQRGTPDAIDLLVVCTEAGMGLESGLQRVAQEMGRSNPPMSKVLNALLDDLRVLPDRRDAFANLGNRSNFEGLRRFGTMMNQSLQYGTPLNNTLRAIANELRRDRITKLEERAHKLGAKLIIPMVIFMLPAMFVVLATSPGLHLLRSLKAIGH